MDSVSFVQVPLENQLLIDLYRMRELAPGSDTKWHGLEAKVDRGAGIPWAQVWKGPQQIVFGHDRQKGLQVDCFKSLTAIALTFWAPSQT